MSHEIDTTTGRAAMAFIGDTPWHGLGTKLPLNASIEEWTHAAGLDYTVERTPVLFQPSHDAGPVTLPGRDVLVRTDTRAPLSVVSDRYIPCQPAQVMDIFAHLSDVMGFKMETAGALFDGRKIWALASAPEGFDMDGDVTGQYLLLSTSFDGSSATLAMPTAVRVVCNNTLSAALFGAKPVKIAHRENVTREKVLARTNLNAAWTTYQDSVRQLAQRFIPEPMPILTAAYYGLTADAAKAKLDTDDKGIRAFVQRMRNALDYAPGANFAKGSAYAVLNAVTYDVDHAKPARSNEHRMLSATEGEGARIKARALAALA